MRQEEKLNHPTDEQVVKQLHEIWQDLGPNMPNLAKEQTIKIIAMLAGMKGYPRSAEYALNMLGYDPKKWTKK